MDDVSGDNKTQRAMNFEISVSISALLQIE